MEWMKPNENLINAILRKDAISSKGTLVAKKGNILDIALINHIKKHNIEKILVSQNNLDHELSQQLETIISHSTQPHFWESYLTLIEKTKKTYIEISKENFEHVDSLLLKLYQTLALLKNTKEFFQFAYNIEGYADSLYRHSVNVAILSYMIAKNGISNEKPFLLAQMGLFHDIGKLLLNQEILNKNNALSADEYLRIQAHTTLGTSILKKMNIQSQEIHNSVLLHHENRNGSGYPLQLNKESIPFSVQIISVADTFDSIAADRVYKKKKTVFNSFLELLTDAIEGKLHPLIVLSFVEDAMNNFLNSTIVLSDKREGTIYHNNPEHFMRPIVLLKDKSFVDLSQKRDISIHNFLP